MEGNLEDPRHGVKVMGSFNKDMSAPCTSDAKSTGKIDLGKADAYGDGKATFPTKSGGLAKTTLPGAEDFSLQKTFG